MLLTQPCSQRASKGQIVAPLIGVFTTSNTVRLWLHERKFTHNCLHSVPSPFFPTKILFLLQHASFNRLRLLKQTCGRSTGGRANNSSEPNPEQHPQWCSYLTLAWGSPWEPGWKRKTDLSLQIGTINSKVTFILQATLPAGYCETISIDDYRMRGYISICVYLRVWEQITTYLHLYQIQCQSHLETSRFSFLHTGDQKPPKKVKSAVINPICSVSPGVQMVDLDC